jgi:hypothetical protein
MPRLVRRKPLLDRIKDCLNPGDFLLWLSEEFETRDWDSKQVGTPLALGLHLVMLLARANSGSTYGSGGDDVFGDYESGSSWLSYIVSLLQTGQTSANFPRPLSLSIFWPTSLLRTRYTPFRESVITDYSRAR